VGGTVIAFVKLNIFHVYIKFAPWNQLDTEKAGVDQVARAKYNYSNVYCMVKWLVILDSYYLMMIFLFLIMCTLSISSRVVGRGVKKTN